MPLSLLIAGNINKYGRKNCKETSEQIAAGYWKKIDERLPSHLTDQQKTWIKNYLQAQVAFSQSDPTEAYKIFTRLGNEKGFPVFKNIHPEYFATMEVVAQGKTDRKGAKILFRKEDL